VDAERLIAAAPLFVWASVHLGGSTHPPHVHSDAAVTGTYYVRRPEAAAPICFEDPRGRSPLDLVAALEHRLRYGGDAADGGGAVPPFHRGVCIAPAAGECVVFPPWLVHSVPPGPESGACGEQTGSVLGELAASDELLRVSFSFNLLGKWELTARTRV
jgi:uncharacterized protein (TIGR02466 family)